MMEPDHAPTTPPWTASANAAAAALTADAARAQSFKRGNPDLIVSFAYGDELPVFVRARALWEFFMSHYPNVRAVFYRETEKLGRGEVMHNGHDLMIGIGGDTSPGALERNGYAATGVWSANENGRAIYRQMALYDYLLRTHDRPFYLYQSTITSVVDLRGLLAALEHVPRTGCYAGMPGRLNTPAEYEGLNFICGTNSLFSSDVMRLMRERYDPNHVYATLPNDIWQALVLQEVPRIPMPFFSFIQPRRQGEAHEDVRAITRHLLADGHFHFRVKTTSEQEGLGKREDVDPWVMLKVMEEILANNPDPAANLRLMQQLKTCAATPDGSMRSFGDPGFFTSERRYPLNDLEAPVVYPDVVK